MADKKQVKLDKKEINLQGQKHKKQRRLIKKRRAGIVLSKKEVKEIKLGRKKLKHQMKKEGIYSRESFNSTAASLGLYFDARHGLIWWLLRHWLGLLLAALAALLAVLAILSAVQKMRGNYTVNLSDDLFKEGFLLSETEDFAVTSSILYATPADEVPCISITQIPADIDSIDGLHNDAYFAYTYYIKNAGDVDSGYGWTLTLTAESNNVSEGIWVMLFEDGEMTLYAKVNSETGLAEALPEEGNDSVGYVNIPVMSLAGDSSQFEVIATVGSVSYYRVIPDPFESDSCVASGTNENVVPGEIHKYTVVLYLEGDDPDVNDDMIGGSLGVAMNFYLISETSDYTEGSGSFWDGFKSFWTSLWGGVMGY